MIVLYIVLGLLALPVLALIIFLASTSFKVFSGLFWYVVSHIWWLVLAIIVIYISVCIIFTI